MLTASVSIRLPYSPQIALLNPGVNRDLQSDEQDDVLFIFGNWQ